LTTNKMIIFIPLLEEGVPVSRPTEAIRIEDMKFLVLPTANYDVDEEIWKFPPGTTVKCVSKNVDGKEILIAVGIA
jgi:hypothetical protein